MSSVRIRIRVCGLSVGSLHNGGRRKCSRSHYGVLLRPCSDDSFFNSVAESLLDCFKMSVVGFDFGDESCAVAFALQGDINDVLCYESSTAIVSSGEIVGPAGAASELRNPENTISQIKRLIGRKFSDPELQRDLTTVPLPFTVEEGPDGFPLIHARDLDETRTFTPTEVLGMLFSNLKRIAALNINAAFDCCIGVPVYFTDLQRRAILEAAAIAGLDPLHLIHETTATALAYGIYKTDLPETDPINVAFVDIGHSSLQVCIAAFKKGQLKVLAHSFDRSLGGRDFDEVLFQHFAAKFKEDYEIDVYQNARGSMMLRTACEKLKKDLSASPVASLVIECVMEDKDVRGVMRRDEFEKLSIPILERVKAPLEKALAEALLTNEEIHAVEVVGSGSRVPSIIKTLSDFFGKEPGRTMKASVAKGCALDCAILSPTFKLKEFQLNESFPFSISMSWKGVGGAAEGQQVVIPKGTPIPCLKAVTIMRSGTLAVDLQYADVSELQAPARISTYVIGPVQSNGDRAKLKVRVRLNLHGIVSIESVTLLKPEVPFELATASQQQSPFSPPVQTQMPERITRNRERLWYNLAKFTFFYLSWAALFFTFEKIQFFKPRFNNLVCSLGIFLIFTAFVGIVIRVVNYHVFHVWGWSTMPKRQYHLAGAISMLLFSIFLGCTAFAHGIREYMPAAMFCGLAFFASYLFWVCFLLCYIIPRMNAAEEEDRLNISGQV